MHQSEEDLRNQCGNELFPTQSKLFVGQIPKDVSEDILRTYFDSFGHIAEVSIIRDVITGISKGKVKRLSFL
jgi:RNA recognition motif-containing protein